MLSELVIWYLFLGGVGGGAYLAWCFLGWYLPIWGTDPERRAFVRATPFVWGAALVATGIGVLCLLSDLSRTSMAHLLFIRPTRSLITLGAFALLFYLAALSALVALWHSGKKLIPSKNRCFLALYSVAGLLAVVVVVYTGFYLVSLSRSVPLWQSLAVPALFVLSALSTGIAVVVIGYSRASGRAFLLYRPLHVLCRADAVVIVAEAALVAVLLYVSRGSVAGQESVRMLVSGELSTVFWTMLVGVGLAVPLLIETGISWFSTKSLTFYIIIAICVLVGGFFLRYSLIHAGAHIAQFMFAG